MDEDNIISCTMCGNDWCTCCPYCHMTPCECGFEDEEDWIEECDDYGLMRIEETF
jgi:hypothetical protein